MFHGLLDSNPKKQTDRDLNTFADQEYYKYYEYYNYYRYYDPETGRYITSDPIGLKGGLNTYGYGNHNPIKYIDPTGEVGVVGGGVGLVIGGVSGFAGTILTGGDFSSAVIAGVIGGISGAVIGATGGIGLIQASVLGSGSNLFGQIISNNIDDNNCNDSYVNWGSVIGSGIGGFISAGLTINMSGVAGQIAGGEMSFMIGFLWRQAGRFQLSLKKLHQGR